MNDNRIQGMDALRGVAAIVVMLHHMVPALTGVAFLPAGYLAVDFFFLLSGFVLDRVYCKRFSEGLAFSDFMTIRLRRLYPTVVIGTLAGVYVALLSQVSPLWLLGHAIAQLLFIPFPNASSAPYPLNEAQWSLAFELVANAVHVVLLARLGNRQLAAFCCAMLVWLLLAVHQFHGIDIGGKSYSLLGGIPRVLFPYALGMLLNRLCSAGRIPTFTVPTGILAAALVALMAIAGLASETWWAGLVATLGFPVILILSVGSRPRFPRLASTLATLSYPLYAIHLSAQNLVGFLQIPVVWARVPIAVAVALASAAAIHRFLGKRETRSPHQVYRSPAN